MKTHSIEQITENLWRPNLGNGQYKNPIIHADYSDPDVIRWGDFYYMTASSFQYVPGLPILRSVNLVDWELVNYALESIPEERYRLPQISEGVWAPSIREHDGELWIFYGMPDEGIYAVKTKNPESAWSKPILIKAGKGYIDPCPYWDEEGNAYVVHAYAKSRIGFKSILGIFQFQKDGKAFDGVDEFLFNGYPDHVTIEGPKVHYKNGFYYVFAPAGGVSTGWQTVLRSSSLHGPYEARIVMEQGESITNGPHQGAWVEDFSGKDYFIHFQDKGAYGRITHLQPMRWENDWPIIGQAAEDAICGNPILEGTIPAAKVELSNFLEHPASDDFSKETLGLQWQWFGNPPEDTYKLNDALILKANNPDECATYSLWQKSNLLTQKLVCPSARYTVTLDISELTEQNAAGLCILGDSYMTLRVTRDEGLRLSLVQADYKQEEVVLDQEDLLSEKITLGMDIEEKENDVVASFFYLVEGKKKEFGHSLVLAPNAWTGAKATLYCISKAKADKGLARFLSFEVERISN